MFAFQLAVTAVGALTDYVVVRLTGEQSLGIISWALAVVLISFLLVTLDVWFNYRAWGTGRSTAGTDVTLAARLIRVGLSWSSLVKAINVAVFAGVIGYAVSLAVITIRLLAVPGGPVLGSHSVYDRSAILFIGSFQSSSSMVWLVIVSYAIALLFRPPLVLPLGVFVVSVVNASVVKIAPLSLTVVHPPSQLTASLAIPDSWLFRLPPAWVLSGCMVAFVIGLLACNYIFRRLATGPLLYSSPLRSSPSRFRSSPSRPSPSPKRSRPAKNRPPPSPDRPRSNVVRLLPDTVRLLDLLQINPPTVDAIVDRWGTGNRSTSVVIGESYDGRFDIDISRDGPHALIIGDTGSGKSELLHTIVTSLAVANQPDAMTFVLIDYKGGNAFEDCVSLPHTVGIVTDLDVHLAGRAMQSLSAELTRREYILLSAGVGDFDEYASLQTGDAHSDRSGVSPLEALPRLLIAVDDCAPILRDLPNFVADLINIAQRGRVLGIHLILATQRLPDMLLEDIRANINLRIALRMTDAAESVEIIDVNSPVYIRKTTPGRAYVRPAHGSLVPIQVGWAGGHWPTVDTDSGRSTPKRRVQRDNGGAKSTDLQALIKAIQHANERLHIPPLRRPWLPPLPGTLILSELDKPARPVSSDGKLAPVVYGLDDLPSEQAQRPAVIDFSSFGHMLAVGASRSGRSQLLRTIAGSIGTTHCCADVHIYGIDCGNGALAPLAELPHCGAVVTSAQAERVATLMRRLSQEIVRRQELLARGMFASIAEQRTAASTQQRLPHIVILLDRWDEFAATLGGFESGELTSVIAEILGKGASVGIHVVITGDQTLISGPIAAMAEDKLVFRMDDSAEFSLIGLRPSDVPDDMSAGRAFRGGSGIETQIALLDGEPTERGQAAALHALAEAARSRDENIELSQRPFQVDVLLLVGDRFHVGDAHGRPVGREDVLAWLSDRYASGACVALLGPRRAGKTWVLTELRERLAKNGSTRVHHVVLPQPSSRIDRPDALARLLDTEIRSSDSPAERLLEEARLGSGTRDRLVYLLDEVGRLADYDAAAVSWLRDLGQAGAWLVYTGTEKDWHMVVRWALTVPGSSFGNDVNARVLGPIM